MRIERGAFSGAWGKDKDSQADPPAGGVLICVFLAFLMLLSCSTVFSSGVNVVPLGEDGSDIPAASLFVTDISYGAYPRQVYAGEEITFWANATSSIGAPITFTTYYDAFENATINPESAVTVNHTDSPGSIVQTYTYDSLGRYYDEIYELTFFYVKFYIYDGHLLNITKVLKIYMRENSAPVFVAAPKEEYTKVVANEPFDVYVRVMDYDGDPIDVFWEFGDGSEATNQTDGSIEDSYANQTHTWSPYVAPGSGEYYVEYQMNVTIVDIWGNNATESSRVVVYVPENIPPAVAISVSSSSIQPGESVTFFGNASDPEGEPLTWTFNYSDGTTEVVHTDWTEPDELVWCNMTHVFEEAGEYPVTLYVSDALPGNQVFPHNMSVGVSITVAVNHVPGVSASITVTPEYPIINSTIGFLNLSFSINAKDLDGDVLTVSWYIDDYEDPVVNTSGGGTGLYKFIQVFTVTEARSYNVTVVVTDGLEGHEVSLSRVVNVSSDNKGPILLDIAFIYAGGDYALPGEDLEFIIVLTDRERDVLEVTLDFGDDSGTQCHSLSDYDSAGQVTLSVHHTYELPGVYTVILRYTDNKIGVGNHSKVLTSAVTVQQAYAQPVTEWDWWDYASLALVFVIPALVVVRMLLIRRRVLLLEKEGLTLNEARIKAEEQFAEKLLRGGGEGGV